MADELIDILKEDGTATNKILLKSEAHRLGLWHASVHIWLYTTHNEVLLQKRAAQKETYPNLWDISVAGHIGAGEHPKESAVREIEEELGIQTSLKSLSFITIHKASKHPTPTIIDREFNHIYCCKLHHSPTELTLQEEEVADTKLISIELLEKELNDPKKVLDYVPHGSIYYQKILDALKTHMR